MFSSQRPPLAPGTHVGKYVVESHLGAGGNGAVYAARDTVLGRSVALKLLHPQLVFDPQIAGRFRQEAQAMAQLNHPNVVTVHDFVGEQGTWAIVMELIEGGETLASLLGRERRLAPLRALQLIKQVAKGLGHAHARGIVHRDVKPANVMLVRHGAGAGAVEIAKISDFGIARLVHGEKRTQGQLTLGTLWYLAPEQAQSSTVDARADVYALGATLYEALTGRVVFPYDNVARVLAAALSEAPTRPSSLVPGLPTALDELVLRFIAKRPEERPAHGDEACAMLEQLEASLEPARLPSHPHGPHPHALRGTPAYSHTPAFSSAPPHNSTPSYGSESYAATLHATPHAGAVTPTPGAHPLAQGPVPAGTDSAASSQRLGMMIGVGALALISIGCLASSFLCVVSGFLR